MCFGCFSLSPKDAVDDEMEDEEVQNGANTTMKTRKHHQAISSPLISSQFAEFAFVHSAQCQVEEESPSPIDRSKSDKSAEINCIEVPRLSISL